MASNSAVLFSTSLLVVWLMTAVSPSSAVTCYNCTAGGQELYCDEASSTTCTGDLCVKFLGTFNGEQVFMRMCLNSPLLAGLGSVDMCTPANMEGLVGNMCFCSDDFCNSGYIGGPPPAPRTTSTTTGTTLSTRPSATFAGSIAASVLIISSTTTGSDPQPAPSPSTTTTGGTPTVTCYACYASGDTPYCDEASSKTCTGTACLKFLGTSNGETVFFRQCMVNAALPDLGSSDTCIPLTGGTSCVCSTDFCNSGYIGDGPPPAPAPTTKTTGSGRTSTTTRTTLSTRPTSGSSTFAVNWKPTKTGSGTTTGGTAPTTRRKYRGKTTTRSAGCVTSPTKWSFLGVVALCWMAIY